MTSKSSDKPQPAAGFNTILSGKPGSLPADFFVEEPNQTAWLHQTVAGVSGEGMVLFPKGDASL